MTAIVLVAFAAHVIAWIVLPDSKKAMKSVESHVLAGSLQPSGA